MIKTIFLFFIILSLFPATSEAKRARFKEKKLCNNITIKGKGVPDFNEVETILICGDDKIDDAVGDSWKNVPRSQSKFHLGIFLQNRGFFNPTITNTEDGYVIDIGEPTIVSELRGEGFPEEFKLWRKRKIVGQILTPAILNEVEKWSISRLQAIGYACPEVTSEGNTQNGIITVKVNPGKKQNVIRVFADKKGKIREGVLERYSAYRVGEVYNGDLFTITERRILQSGVQQGVNFVPICTDAGVEIKRSDVEGLPRLLRFGIGTNTEGILLLKATYTNTRVGSHASIFNVNFFASNQTQELNAYVDWYNLGQFSRRYLRPSFEVARQNEDPFETSSVRGAFHLGSSFDGNNLGMKLHFGPTLEYITTVRGFGPKETFFTSLELNAQIMSHNFEYYIRSPRTGYKINFKANLNSDDFESTVNAQRLKTDWEFMYNYKKYDIPYWTLGFRGSLGTIISDDRPGVNTNIPPNFLYYLGGSNNLRGFPRLGLTQNNTGGMSMAYFGLEARSVDNRIPYNIQPFVFADVGALGNTPMTIDSPFYYSPGVGLRWESPVGTIRGTLGQGITEGSSKKGVQFYFSFGEEF